MSADQLRCSCEEPTCIFHKGACQQTAQRFIKVGDLPFFLCSDCHGVAVVDLGDRVTEDMVLL